MLKFRYHRDCLVKVSSSFSYIMFVIKLTILTTLLVSTKQEQYWKYLPLDEFNTNMSLDLKAFTKYEQLCEFSINLHCVTIYDSGQILINGQSSHCSSNKTFKSKLSSLNIKNRSCALQGVVRNVEFLVNYDEEDDLVFISLEGCFTRKDEIKSPVNLLMTNNVETEYETMKSNHFWKQISFGNIISCNILCTNVVLERKLVKLIHLESKSKDLEEYWNFLSFDDFRTRDISSELDMTKFKKYEFFKKEKVNYNCLLGYSNANFNLIVQRSQCCDNGFSKKNMKPGNAICPLQGEVETVQFLRNKDVADSLIFVSIEGCYTLDEFGCKSHGTVLMTNNVTTSYSTYKSDYIWTEIPFSELNCSVLCSNIVLDRCFSNKTKTRLMSPLMVSQTLKYAVLKFDEGKIDFIYMKIIIICLSIIFITSFLTILIYKLVMAKKDEDNGKF